MSEEAKGAIGVVIGMVVCTALVFVMLAVGAN